MARVLIQGVEYRSLSHAMDVLHRPAHTLKALLDDPATLDSRWLEAPVRTRAVREKPTKGGASAVVSLGRLVQYPDQWPNDGGRRREKVYDPDYPSRLVAVVGWTSCLCCRGKFFSWDIRQVRLCDPCKSAASSGLE